MCFILPSSGSPSSIKHVGQGGGPNHANAQITGDKQGEKTNISF